MEQFDQVPIVTLAAKFPGYPYVCFDNESGLYDGVTQLIKQYDRTNIGFVSGPITNQDARERLQAYRAALMDNGIAFLPERVVYGNFSEYSEDAVIELLAKNEDLDAIVFANDSMAIGGYRVLKAQRREIGSEILTLGFDDMPSARGLEPGLSTVRADSAKMGYESVKHCMELATGLESQLIIETTLVVRESFGETQPDYTPYMMNLKGKTEEEMRTEVLENAYKILFEGCHDQDLINQHKGLLKECVDYIFGLIYKKRGNAILCDVLGQKLKKWLHCRQEIAVSRMVSVMDYLTFIVEASLPDEQSKLMYEEMIKNIYKDIFLFSDQKVYAQTNMAEWIGTVLTTSARDLLNYSNGDDRVYRSMVEKINLLYMKECYLYIYPEIYQHSKDEEIKLPSTLALKICKNDTRCECPPEQQQQIAKENLFDHAFMPEDKAHVLVADMLFSGTEIYGVFAAAVDYSYFKHVKTVTMQLSSQVRTIFLLQQNARMTARLEEHIKQIRENNHMLNEISKRDELTGIYNRRGFMAAVEDELRDPMNRDKKAIMIYADMNNLKKINDQFGHEDGDYALRMIASILKESFRSTDIIGRFGGDEFAAFALVNQENYVTKLRKRIETMTVRANEVSDRPYYVSMSTGICEFLCEDGVSITDIMDTADGDLYSQKKFKRTDILKADAGAE